MRVLGGANVNKVASSQSIIYKVKKNGALEKEVAYLEQVILF